MGAGDFSRARAGCGRLPARRRRPDPEDAEARNRGGRRRGVRRRAGCRGVDRRHQLMKIGRRDLFRYGGLGGGAGLLAGLIGAAAGVRPTYGAKTDPEAELELDCINGPVDSAYGQKYQPPAYFDAATLERAHTPPPFVAAAVPRTQDVDLTVIETTLEVANGTNVRVWAYGGSVPGPV